MTNLWVLTEEKPKRSVVKDILVKYSEEYNKSLEFDLNGEFSIVPIFKDKKYTFTCEVYGITIEDVGGIYIKTVSGSSSFVDYLLIEQEEEPKDGEMTNLIMAFEETKTSDEESRNTGVYQRGTKFAFLRGYSKSVKMYMLYNDELNTSETKKPSNTNLFGTNMLLTLGVDIMGKNNLSWFKKFDTLDEFIEAKNSMKRPPKGNVPILINRYDDRIEVSGRLSKPANRGNIGHDPNIGALSLISTCIRKMGWDKRIVIIIHGVSQEYVDRKRVKNKFLYMCKLYNVELDGINMPEDYKLPEKYWHYEKGSEKVTSIMLHILAENKNIDEVYQNHAGCERGYFYTKNRVPITLPKKDSTGLINLFIPDLILYDSASNTILLIEAKRLYTLKAGLKEIKHYDSIEREYIDKFYPNSKKLRYLTLFGGNKVALPHKQVLVYMNLDGTIFVNPDAPNFIKNLFE